MNFFNYTTKMFASVKVYFAPRAKSAVCRLEIKFQAPENIESLQKTFALKYKHYFHHTTTQNK